jgi:hypothetical protein
MTTAAKRAPTMAGFNPFPPPEHSRNSRTPGGESSESVPESSHARSIVLVDAVEMAKPLPELDYLVPALGLASGAPVLVAGYGFAGKTVSLQSLALSVATGRSVWGVYGCTRGRVVHLDYEQGRRVTHERYQRLASGMGFDLAAVGDSLRLAVNPAVYLHGSDALDVYKRVCDGTSLVIVDSLRAAAPTLDENASEVRQTLDLMNRAAEPYGTVVVFVHHVRKPKSEGDGGARYRIRGSSALYDAAGSVFVFGAEKGQPTRVEHEKCRNRGILVDDFGLRIEDVDRGEGPTGLRVVHLEAQQLAAAGAPRGSALTAQADRIVAYLRALPGGEYRGAKTGMLERTLHMNKSHGYAALDELKSRGVVVIGEDDRGKFVRLASDTLDTLGHSPRALESNGKDSHSRALGVESESVS